MLFIIILKMAYRNPSHNNPVERSSDPCKQWWIGTFGVRVEDSVDSIPYNDGVSTLSRMSDDKGNYTYVVCVQGVSFKTSPFEREEYFELFCDLINGEYYFSPKKFYLYTHRDEINQNNQDSDSDDGEQMAMYAEMLNSKD